MKKLILVLAISLIALPSFAIAQDNGPIHKIIRDVSSKTQSGQHQGSGETSSSGSPIFGNGDQLAKLLSKPFNDLADFINSDAAAAATLATQIPELQDGHGQQCFIAMGQFTAVLKAHPIPLTLHAATDLEAFRLAAMAANNLCQNAHCTQVFTDLGNSIQKAAPVQLGIQIPNLSSLCSYVPQVTVVAPISVPVVAPVPDTAQ